MYNLAQLIHGVAHMPMRRLPPLTALRSFEAAARLASFKNAARELSVTPGAVSQQVKALEADLGVALFVRGARTVRLTAAGQHLQPILTDALLKIRQAVDDVRPSSAKTLRITSTNALISKWLLPRLHRFTSAHPDLQVHINSDTSFSNPSGSGADIEIRYGKEPPKSMYVETLHREMMRIVASPSFLKENRVESVADLADVPVLLDVNSRNEENVSSWNIWAQHAGLASSVELSKLIQFENLPGGQVIDAAIAGLGIGLCGSLLTQVALSDGRLVSPFGPAVASGHSYFLCCPLGRQDENHILEFFRWVCNEADALSGDQARAPAT